LADDNGEIPKWRQNGERTDLVVYDMMGKIGKEPFSQITTGKTRKEKKIEKASLSPKYLKNGKS